jgi:hypothetical protein
MASQERMGPNSAAGRQVGYFRYLKLEGRHLGGILVTNQVGIPVEFKYTEPISTTRIHKILYGATLDKYLHETVIRERLSREIRSVPDYYIAPYDERDFLGLTGGREMMGVQGYSLSTQEPAGPFLRLREREAVVALEDGPVLRVAFSSADETVQRTMAIWLQEIARTMDVLEPLERVANALTSLCAEDGKAGSPG